MGPLSMGAQLAVSELNAIGGVEGADGTLFRLELVVQPTDNLEASIANINQASVIAVVGPAENEVALQGVATLQSLNVPILSPATDDTLLIQDTSNLVFRSRTQQRLIGMALANYLVGDIGVSSIATVQFDVESTASVIGFATALSPLNIAPQSFLYDPTTNDAERIADSIVSSNPQVVATFGPPDLARELYIALRSGGWQGRFVYDQATAEDFQAGLPISSLAGILNGNTWAFTTTDDISTQFMNNFVRTFGQIPGAIEAAGYDSIYLLAQAIGQAGSLQDNLAQIQNFEGVQGILSPADLSVGETSTNVVITELNAFGIPQVIARFINGERIPEDEPDSIVLTQTPTPTATPDGFTATIKSAVQNVRTGPSTDYDILGQLQEGEQVRVIGATVDFSWVVINYRGQQGWLATFLLDTFGDRNTVPVIAPPPTPTPPPATATPTVAPVADVVIVNATPTNITLGFPFSLNVTVRNQGSLPAGAFAVATTFQPDGNYNATNIPGLAPGQELVVTLNTTLTSATGPQSILIIADLNNQVNEGPAGEANNNTFTYNYMVDRPILNTGTIILNPGGTLNLEGAGTNDVMWNGAGNSLDFIAPPPGSGMYIIENVNSLQEIHHGMIDTSKANVYNLNVALLNNAYIGIVTAEGNFGAMHVDNVVSGGQITLTYKVYQP